VAFSIYGGAAFAEAAFAEVIEEAAAGAGRASGRGGAFGRGSLVIYAGGRASGQGQAQGAPTLVFLASGRASGVGTATGSAVLVILPVIGDGPAALVMLEHEALLVELPYETTLKLERSVFKTKVGSNLVPYRAIASLPEGSRIDEADVQEVRVRMYNPDTEEVVIDAPVSSWTLLGSKRAVEVTYEWASADLDTDQRLESEVRITVDGKVAVCPTKGRRPVVVAASIPEKPA
jgi:hypothetical protein